MWKESNYPSGRLWRMQHKWTGQHQSLIVLMSRFTYAHNPNAKYCPRTSIQSLIVCCCLHVLMNQYNFYVYFPSTLFQPQHSCFSYKALYISRNVSSYDTGTETKLTSNVSASRDEHRGYKKGKVPVQHYGLTKAIQSLWWHSEASASCN